MRNRSDETLDRGCYIPIMTRHELEALFARVLEWPEERQADVLNVLKQMEEQGTDVYELTPEEWAQVEDGIAQAERGEFVSDEEMEAFWKKCGL